MKEKEYLVKTFDFEGLTVGMRTDDIIHVYIKSEAVINRKMQDEIIKTIIILKQNNNEKLPAIIEFGEFISLSEDIVSHTGLDYKHHILSVAIYAKNIADRILSKYYSRKYNTSTFTIFNTFGEAVQHCHESSSRFACIS